MCLIFRPKKHCLILNCSSVMTDQNVVVSSVPEFKCPRIPHTENSGTPHGELWDTSTRVLKTFYLSRLHSMSLAGSKYNKIVQDGKQYT